MIYLACIFAYLLLLAGVGIRQSRRVKTEDDFTVAGRSLSPWVMVCTMLAVWIGTGSIVGNAEQTYKTGMAALILPIGTFFGMILLSLIARRARSIEATSVPGIIQRRFGNTARNLAMLSLIIAYMVIVSYQFNAGGAVLEVIAGDKPAVPISAGDRLDRRQLVKGRLIFTPDRDWAGNADLALGTEADGDAGMITWPVRVVAADDLQATTEELEKDGQGTALKTNSFTRLRLNPEVISGPSYVVANAPEHGTLKLVEPILTARTATLIAAVCIIGYTTLAGLMSLASMDILNGTAIMVTMVIALPVYWFKAGGWSGMETAFAAMGDRPDHMQFWGVYSNANLINYILPVFLLVLGDANQYQRIFASRNAKGARTAVTAMIFVAFAIELLIIACAWIAASMTPDPEDGKYILIFAAKHYLALPLGCLFMVTVVAIIFSTANSFLHVSASTAMSDLYVACINPKASQKRLLFLSRLMVVVFGVVAYFVTMMFAETTGFFRKALYAFTIYGSSITPALVAAIVWKRATTPGAIASILTGTIVSLVWSMDSVQDVLPPAVSGLDAVLPALLASVTCLIAVSLLTKEREVPVDKVAATGTA